MKKAQPQQKDSKEFVWYKSFNHMMRKMCSDSLLDQEEKFFDGLISPSAPEAFCSTATLMFDRNWVHPATLAMEMNLPLAEVGSWFEEDTRKRVVPSLSVMERTMTTIGHMLREDTERAERGDEPIYHNPYLNPEYKGYNSCPESNVCDVGQRVLFIDMLSVMTCFNENSINAAIFQGNLRMAQDRLWVHPYVLADALGSPREEVEKWFDARNSSCKSLEKTAMMETIWVLQHLMREDVDRMEHGEPPLNHRDDTPYRPNRLTSQTPFKRGLGDC